MADSSAWRLWQIERDIHFDVPERARSLSKFGDSKWQVDRDMNIKNAEVVWSYYQPIIDAMQRLEPMLYACGTQDRNELSRTLTAMKQQHIWITTIPDNVVRNMVRSVVKQRPLSYTFPFGGSVRFQRQHGRNLMAMEFPSLGIVEIDPKTPAYEGWLANQVLIVTKAMIWFRWEGQQCEPWVKVWFNERGGEVVEIAHRVRKRIGPRVPTKVLKAALEAEYIKLNDDEITLAMDGQPGWRRDRFLYDGKQVRGYTFVCSRT